MSISMQRFESSGCFATYDPGACGGPPPVTLTLQCRHCAFQPDDPLIAPRLCPRCHGSSFERVAVPGILLLLATSTPRVSTHAGA